MNDYKNNYNVRDEKGRFVAKSTTAPRDYSNPVQNKKEDYLKVLREKDVVVTYHKNGDTLVNIFSLQPSYFTSYVGKGTSKKADDNVIFAYDIDAERFKKIEVSQIASFIAI